ncbi:adenylyl-sulfate kinase [Streptosporangium subroseum]|uniref:adenylyl-sulfate kinase n=1 Tax=Streptosporangium subroseum TaxID=106412 RepID=UPI00341EE8C2
MSTRESSRALLITGTVGAGKTSVADTVGDLLIGTEVPHAVIDLDWLRRSWPTPPGDRFNIEMELRNLRSVARNYLDAGALRLVLAGVVENRDDRQRYRDAIGVDLTVCRLHVELPVVHQRLARRHAGEDASLRWHLERSERLDQILGNAQIEDFVIEATDRSVTEVAAAVVKAAGWS